MNTNTSTLLKPLSRFNIVILTNIGIKRTSLVNLSKLERSNTAILHPFRLLSGNEGETSFLHSSRIRRHAKTIEDNACSKENMIRDISISKCLTFKCQDITVSCFKLNAVNY